MAFYAHSNTEKDKSQWHLLKNHLQDTASLAATFAKSFRMEKLAYIAGLLHDIGKYNPLFQKRLEGDSARIDHSTPGAIEAEKHYGLLGILLAYVVSGHHCGLPDWGSEACEASLAARLKKENELGDYSSFSKEIDLPPSCDIVRPNIKPVSGGGFSVQFLIRFIYSCLVDADFLDTERTLNAKKSHFRFRQYCLSQLADKLDQFLNDIAAKVPDTSVNKKRGEILAACQEKALLPPGLFTLTVPTGGGKTLSSLSFALRHALCHGKERVIYVIPYTSIIEQNAAVFRKVLGDENVLEHHSNFTYPQEGLMEEETEYVTEMGKKLKLAAENWDMPITVTTNVQFFESLFAARSSQCRKLHNIANSVVIIDEAQMIPTKFLKPCLAALAELVVNYNTTVVLCTATQPAIKGLLPEAISPVEIMDDPSGLYQAFRRVQVQNIGFLSDDELADRMMEHNQVLCIVNSKKHARLLFDKMKGEVSFHLSTRMCPEHRTKVLKKIKTKLKEGKTCRVVSTQLIEAGVDVDFAVVYRSMAGIDSIAQAAGRCNREGLLEIGQVFVFRPEKHGMPRGWLNRTASLGRHVFERHEDPLGLEGVRDYFTSLYDIDSAQLDQHGILVEIKEQERQLRFPFRTIAEKFKLIEDKNMHTVIVPWDENCRRTLKEAEQSPFPGNYTRLLQRYSIGVYEDEFHELNNSLALEVVVGRFYVLRENVFTHYYSPETGLNPFLENMFINDTLIV